MACLSLPTLTLICYKAESTLAVCLFPSLILKVTGYGLNGATSKIFTNVLKYAENIFDLKIATLNVD